MNLGRYQFYCRFTEEALLPAYKGSTFRGAFGSALKKVVCAVREKECSRCLLANRCLYARVFEATSKQAGLRQATPPHPYVIEPPLDTKTCFVAGDPFEFNLLLFGEFTDSLPYFVYAFEAMGEQGLGVGRKQGRGRYVLEKVRSGHQELYDGESRRLAQPPTESVCLSTPQQISGTLKLRLLTPLRLKHENQLQAELPFHVLVRGALRRISSLNDCFGQGEPDLDYRGLVARAQHIKIASSHLRWCDWKRYSSRQDQFMLMGGMTGEIIYQGAIGEFLPLLELVRELHLGKQSTFGLGLIDYTFEPDASI